MPFGVETTSPFLYLCGVAGNDLGDVGIDRGRPSIIVGSMLDVLARDCDVLERFKRALWWPVIPALLPRPPPNSPNRAPGVSEMDLPGVRGPESATQNEMSSFLKSSSLSSWSCAPSNAELGVTASDRGVTVSDVRNAEGDDSLLDKFHSSHLSSLLQNFFYSSLPPNKKDPSSLAILFSPI
jgi:hypothetical protein